jgi:glutathione S-transferase
MSLTLYGHPFSSYTQKALIALYENGLEFDYRSFEGHPENYQDMKGLWPIGQFPVLVDDGRTIAESSIVIEHLQLFHPGPVRLIPDDPKAAIQVRFLDRFFDNHVMAAMQAPVLESLRPDGRPRDQAIQEAAAKLDVAYAWLEEALKGRTWAAGEAFTLADCAAAPSLFYADWVHQIGPRFPTLRAYRTRLLERPSFHRAVEEARPYRSFFPLGAPDRD